MDYLDEAPLLYNDNTDKALGILTQYERDENFKKDVRAIYQNRCAISGVNLYAPNGDLELQAAHIFPKSQNGRDDVRNGILLSRIFHWALDCGWISISEDYHILVRHDIPKTDDFKILWKYKESALNLPIDKKCYPHKIYLSEHRKLFKFE